jgi:hypothetical protein
MNKLLFSFLAVISLLFATGCTEKFDVAAPYKNITIVFGLLDQSDTAHYIRVQKAFLDQNKSAVSMAQAPDSNFYPNLNVRIERYNFLGVYKDSIHLNRVDLNKEGYPKQPGAFFNAPNYAYKFTDLLDPNFIYRIKTTNLTTGETDSSDAPILEDKNTSNFYVYNIDDSSGVRLGLDFAKTGQNDHLEIFGHYSPVNNFNFNGQNTPAAVAQLFIRFNWLDSNVTTHQKTRQSYDYNAGYLTFNNGFSFKIDDITLYSALATALGIAPANTQRLIDRSDIFIYLGTQDFLNYQQNSLTQGTGLTGSEIEPIYTNIKGANALGLFTSRAMKTNKQTITLNTIDSLMLHPLLQAANIKGTAY